MKCVFCFFTGSSMIFFLSVIGLLYGCQSQGEVKEQKKIDDGHSFKNVFGEEYYATGDYLNSGEDSIETDLWLLTNLTTKTVMYGKYSNGLPNAEWRFVFNGAAVLASQWSQFKNSQTKCTFSLPFEYNETIVDSNYFRLRTMNDSLGKISIIVGVSDTVMKDSNLIEFGSNSEVFLRQQGYSFDGNRKKIVKAANGYFFKEYFMKDSANRDAKLYNLYGYTPSRNHFVEFTLFHDGPKEEAVKMIYNLIVNSMYINDERFFNPHLN